MGKKSSSRKKAATAATASNSASSSTATAATAATASSSAATAARTHPLTHREKSDKVHRLIQIIRDHNYRDLFQPPTDEEVALELQPYEDVFQVKNSIFDSNLEGFYPVSQCTSGPVMKYLLNHGADINTKTWTYASQMTILLNSITWLPVLDTTFLEMINTYTAPSYNVTTSYGYPTSFLITSKRVYDALQSPELDDSLREDLDNKTVLYELADQAIHELVQRKRKINYMIQDLIRATKDMAHTNSSYITRRADFVRELMQQPLDTPEYIEHLCRVVGVDPNMAEEEYGYTPLAIMLSRTIIFRPIVSHDFERERYLLEAITKFPDIERMMDALIRGGADPYIKNNDGKNCFDLIDQVLAVKPGPAEIFESLEFATNMRRWVRHLRKKWLSETRSCHVCGQKETEETPLQLCGGCKQVSYCSREHQKSDWKTHKLECPKMQQAMEEKSAKEDAADQMFLDQLAAIKGNQPNAASSSAKGGRRLSRRLSRRNRRSKRSSTRRHTKK